MTQQNPDTIKALEEILESLRIIKDNVSNRSTELATSKIEEMSTALAPAVYNENAQANTLKSMVLDSEWFNRD